jgi:phosphonate transport system substrate-binding protein
LIFTEVKRPTHLRKRTMNGIWTRRQAIQGLLGGSLLSTATTQAQEREERQGYSVAVVPQFPASELHRDWTPFLKRISQATGFGLNMRLQPSIPRFESEMMLGTPDFAFMNPYHAVMAMRSQGYVPLLRNAQALSGILVVPKTSEIKTLQELDGKELAFPAPNAFGASLWMRALLAERERIRITPVYVQTHSNVYRQVLRGKAAAGGGVNNTLMQESDDIRANLRILFETPGVAPHPLSAHPRVPAKARQAVVDAVLQMAGDAEGQALLKEVFMSKPVKADYARDYSALEQYKLEKYVVLEAQG